METKEEKIQSVWAQPTPKSGIYYHYMIALQLLVEIDKLRLWNRSQRCNRGEIFWYNLCNMGQTLGWNGVKVSENLGANAVALVAPVECGYIPDLHKYLISISNSSCIVFKHMNQIIFQNLKFWILVIFRAALNSMPNTIFLPLQASELSNFCKLILKFQGNQHCFLGRRLYFCAVLLNGGWPLWPN